MTVRENERGVDGEIEKAGKTGRASSVVDSSSEGELARTAHSTLRNDWYSGPVHQYCVTETRRANRI